MSAPMTDLRFDEIEQLALQALLSCRVRTDNATHVARSIADVCT